MTLLLLALSYASSASVALCIQCVPTAISKLADGRLSVRFKNAETSEEREEVFDTVLTATGRVADTAKLGLDLAGVKVESE